MRMINLLSATVGLLLLAGCNEAYHDDPPPPPPPQALTDFVVIDSYGVDSGYSPDAPLAIDPFVNAGVFEVFWQARFSRYYSFYLSVSETPYIADAVPVYETGCGPGQHCNLDGYALCQYNQDFTLFCENGPVVDMLEVVYEVPQNVYFFAEVCGAHECNYQRLKVGLY
ncbi:hypothetical protein [Gilvimarinus sp. DA14]|uniref:hypothetical protein n=1 Tax=Gilvimarinus sp. DA14 TaxID=2956798 RepID=UPI0020B63CCC|nr:hypothetical protein [Gilvimarinus sp. DA14]UTF61292.1 hypothetical protein NHM04_05690 [Gilvimarinus sp. DA14]